MASSLTSTAVSSTVSSASLRRFSLLPTHHQQPNSVSLPRPTSFPAIRAQSSSEKASSSSSSAGDSKVAKSAQEIKEISIDTLKEESERVNKEIEGVNEKIVEKIGQDTNNAVADAKAVNKELQKAAEDVAEKTAERVGDIWDAATGKSSS